MARHPLAPVGIGAPLDELRWWPWQELAKYPHLRPEESLLMSELIASMPDAFSSVCYDVPVGPVGVQVDEGDVLLASVADPVSRCKIDALAWDGTTLWLIELKVYALPQAVGQVLMYLCLITPDLPTTFPVLGVVVCRAAHAAALHCAAAQQVGVALLTGDGVQLAGQE